MYTTSCSPEKVVKSPTKYTVRGLELGKKRKQTVGTKGGRADQQASRTACLLFSRADFPSSHLAGFLSQHLGVCAWGLSHS